MLVRSSETPGTGVPGWSRNTDSYSVGFFYTYWGNSRIEGRGGGVEYRHQSEFSDVIECMHTYN